MGIYAADVTFEERVPTWEELFERAKVRYGGECRRETRPEPARREHAVMRTNRASESIDLHRRDGKISFGHGPQVFPFARAVHRTLVDFGGLEDGVHRVTRAPGDARISLADLATRIRRRIAKVELAHTASWDPPLDTAHGPLLSEGTLIVDRAHDSFEMRIHHRSVQATRRARFSADGRLELAERWTALLEAAW